MHINRKLKLTLDETQKLLHSLGDRRKKRITLPAHQYVDVSSVDEHFHVPIGKVVKKVCHVLEHEVLRSWRERIKI